MRPETLRLIVAGGAAEGRRARGGARRGHRRGKARRRDLIPLCHPLLLTHVDVDFRPEVEDGVLAIEATVRLEGRTGAEMEALTAVSVAALTVYDMCKAVDRAMEITSVRLLRKRGGASGVYVRRGESP